MPARPKLNLYGRSAASTVAAKALIYGSAFVSLWLATRILAKPDYGTYAYAVAIMWLASVPATLGLDQTVLVRVARGSGDGGPLIAATLWAALLVGCGFAVALVVAAPHLGAALAFGGLEFWVAGLAATVPLLAISSVFESWYVAQGRVWGGQVFPALGHAARVPLLAIAAVAGGGRWSIVATEIVVALLPVVLFLADRQRPAIGRRVRASAADIVFGARMLVARLASEGVRRLDILMLGALATAVAVADFAIAARLVIVIELGRELLQPAFTSRLGALLGQRDPVRVAREYGGVRAVSVLVGVAAAAGIALLGREVLGLFGDFASAYPPLLILAAAGMINLGFGNNNHFLKLAGHAAVLVWIRLAMLAVMFAANLILIPRLGASGAALGFALAMLVANLMFSGALWRLERVSTVDARSLAISFGAVAATLLAAAGVISPVLATAALLSLGIAYAVVEPRSWRPAVMELRQLRR